MNYSHSKTRSLAGTISDRYADSLETLTVIGDTSLDIDEFYKQTKERDGYPVYVQERRETRDGCASAVARMAEALGARTNLYTDIFRTCVKRRLIVKEKVICRLDDDLLGEAKGALPQGKVVVLADYARGVLDGNLMTALAKQYAGREIIADWHPSRPLDFYSCATALKASWDAPFTGRPLIRTKGEQGLVLETKDYIRVFPALNTNALDPCGAGDMVLATLGVGRLLGLDWPACCQWATETAANVCANWGSVYEPASGPAAWQLRSSASRSHSPHPVGEKDVRGSVDCERSS